MAQATQRRSAASPTIEDLGDEFADELALGVKKGIYSPATRQTYMTAVEQFTAFLHDRGMPTAITAITRDHVEAFLEHLLDTRSKSTAKTRHGGLGRFFNWCVEEGELDRSPMEKVRPPRPEDKPVPVLSDDEVRSLLKATNGTDFYSRRDHAIVRLLIDSGMRRAEITRLTVDDLDFDRRVVRVLGKGRRFRSAPFGLETSRALKRYLRSRRDHVAADRPELWLGKSGPLGDAGIAQMLERRGEQVGIDGLHAHQFRHTFAHQHLANGGNEGDLMMLAGWRKRDMLDRYARSAAAQRALDNYEAPGDRL